MMPRRGFMDAMNNKEVETSVPLEVMAVIVFKTFSLFELWGGTEVSTSKEKSIYEF